MEFEIRKNVMPDPAARQSFDALARQVFGLSFEGWYQSGYWTESNLPYTLLSQETALANVSVNRLEVLLDGKRRRYIQLGTVMTRPDCRRQGLAKRLMEEVLRDWADRCDGMFLFANETVLDFYPQFGFRREIQYQYTLPVPTARGGARKLSVDSPQDLALLRACYKRGNPFSALQVVENFGLLMFYCGSFLKDCVYYIPQQNAVAVARQEGPVLQCMDIFGGSDLEEILSQTAARARSGPPWASPLPVPPPVAQSPFPTTAMPSLFWQEKRIPSPAGSSTSPTCSTLELISGITAWSE